MIVVSNDASISEKTAARELSSYIRQISGAEIPVVDHFNKKGRNIFIRYNTEAMNFKNITIERREAKDEGNTSTGKGKNIFIIGGSVRGTMYGVYSFLEKFFGVRWYAPDCTKVPKMDKFIFKDFSYSEAHAIKYGFVQYKCVENNHEWCAHNRNNELWDVEANAHGGIEAYWRNHTLGHFIPTDKYFKDHPEYFSLRSGERMPYSQLCLTNPNVLRICIKKL